MWKRMKTVRELRMWCWIVWVNVKVALVPKATPKEPVERAANGDTTKQLEVHLAETDAVEELAGGLDGRGTSADTVVYALGKEQLVGHSCGHGVGDSPYSRGWAECWEGPTRRGYHAAFSEPG